MGEVTVQRILEQEGPLFDPLTFTICTGNEDDRKLGQRPGRRAQGRPRGHPERPRRARQDVGEPRVHVGGVGLEAHGADQRRPPGR